MINPPDTMKFVRTPGFAILMMLSLFVVLIFLWRIPSCKAQKPANDTLPALSPKISNIAKEIARDNVLKSSGVGEAGMRTDQWERFETLTREASDTELTALMKYPNAVVRCYAFQGMILRGNTGVYQVLLRLLHDTASVETFQGCIVSSTVAGDYCLNLVYPVVANSDTGTSEAFQQGHHILTKEQSSAIDSILLYDPSIRLAAKYELLYRMKPAPVFYHRVREIATNEGSPEAALALARFHKPADTAIIRRLFNKENTGYFAAYCAREFPDESFYPLLVTMFEHEWAQKYYDYPKWRMIYQALARYPKPITFHLFERTIQSADHFRYQTLGTYLMVALTRYPDKLFEPLKDHLKLDQYHQEELTEYLETEK